MPEGHSIHRLALAFEKLKQLGPVRASSPQGRFSAGAAQLDGSRLRQAYAHGKHLFMEFAVPEPATLHLHLGLYGSWTFETAPALARLLPTHIGAPRTRNEHLSDRVRALAEAGEFSAPGPNVRLRLEFPGACADLTGPNQCELLSPAEVEAKIATLGPDPLVVLRARAAESANFVAAEQGKPQEASSIPAVKAIPAEALRGDAAESEAAAAFSAGICAGEGGTDSAHEVAVKADAAGAREFVQRIKRTRRPVAVAVMDQAVVAGVGNIYRCESLFTQRINPHVPAASISEKRLRALWAELTRMLVSGVGDGRIVTAPGMPTRNWVYQRTGEPCYVCGAPIREEMLAGRRNYWCASCQRR